MSDVDVTPPATGTWYDATVTVAAVLAVLRLQPGDVDADRLTALIPVAAGIIDDYVDRVVVLDGPPPLPQIQHALERTVIDLYRTDVPAAVSGAGPSWLPDNGVFLRAQLDSIIAAKRERFGVS